MHRRLVAASVPGGHYAIVQTELSSEGAGELRLGLNRVAAQRLLSEWGDCRAFRRGRNTTESLVVHRGSASVFAYFDESEHVNAVEFATPGYGVHAVDQVVFEGIDLFFRPADDVVQTLSRRGHRLVHSERGTTTTLPDVLLELWRNGGPMDSDERPLFFESALIAHPSYYD